MRDRFKLLIKKILRLVLKIYYIFPVKKNRVFFMSTMGKQYSCNPKYIFENMIKNCEIGDKELEYIWAFNNPNKFKNINAKLICKNNIFVYFYYLLTSKVIVYNCGGFSYAPIRKNQFLVETWHGGGAFKKVGFAIKDKSKASKIGIKMASNDIKLFLSSSEVSSEKLIKDAMNYKGEILNSGLPRNDRLFIEDLEFKNSIKEKIGIKREEKLVLYAPTFKGDESKAVSLDGKWEKINPSEIKQILKEKFGGEWVFAVRGHQYNDEIKIEDTDINLSKYEDMQELLIVTDILITDYSSSIWDFAITKRPCFLFTPDLVNYKHKERGFLVPIKKWPGIIAKSNLELKYKISEFDFKEYNNKLNKFFIEMGSYEKGTANDIVIDRIIKELKK